MTTVAERVRVLSVPYLWLPHVSKEAAVGLGMETVWDLAERLGFKTHLPAVYACAHIGLVEGFLISPRRVRFFRPTNEEDLRAFAAVKLLCPHKSAKRIAEDLFGSSQTDNRNNGTRP